MRSFFVFFSLIGMLFSGSARATVISDNLCVQGNVTHATAYKAFLSVPESIVFPFGATVPFVTTDDPNGDAQEEQGVYRAPLTGYYVLTFSIGNMGVDPGLPLGSLLALKVLRNAETLLASDVGVENWYMLSNLSL